MEDSEVIILSSSDEKDTRLSNLVRCKQEDDVEDHGGPPLNNKPCICTVKKDMDIKRVEAVEDCFILDFNPFDHSIIDIAKLAITDDDDELSVVAEKGQVACRDYPHSRHLCLRFPFDKTPHKEHCQLCYCYVCDIAAPCEFWMSHCHASEHIGDWKSQRNSTILKLRRTPIL